jgi:hypothetical protein
MYVPFKIHYRNNLIDKKHSYLIPRPPSWDDRHCSYGHQLYHSEYYVELAFYSNVLNDKRILCIIYCQNALSLSEQSSNYASQHIVSDIHHLRDHNIKYSQSNGIIHLFMVEILKCLKLVILLHNYN